MFARGSPGSYPRLGRGSVLQFGVDTHKATLSVAAVDAVGRVVAEAVFANDPAGHQQLRCWAAELGAQRCIGVEGSGAWGYGLAAALVAAGERVVEVPAVWPSANGGAPAGPARATPATPSGSRWRPYATPSGSGR